MHCGSYSEQKTTSFIVCFQFPALSFAQKKTICQKQNQTNRPGQHLILRHGIFGTITGGRGRGGGGEGDEHPPT